jgi:TPR repeat protein
MFQSCAEAGHKEACMYIGLMYRYGFGVTQDFQASLEWYKRAADAFPDDCQAQIVFLEKRMCSFEMACDLI